jgi:hypothetical protein
MCPQLIQQNTIQFIIAENFLQISEENIALLLTQDMLNVENELVLIYATVSWARCEAQRRGIAGDDAGVRAVLEPRLLSLLRFLTLTKEQFVSGPALSNWLTGDEKKAITNYQYVKNITALPKHLSSSTGLRKKSSLKNSKSSCIRTNNFFTTDKTGSLYNSSCLYGSCLNVSGLFRVTENCTFLGLILPSQQEDDTTVLSPKLHVYDECISVNVSDCGISLHRYNPFKQLSNKYYKAMSQYNTTFFINFDIPLQLSTDRWYEININVIISNKSHGAYPDIWRATNGFSNGIEYIFHTEPLKGHRTSMNANFIQSLILSPIK